jgi:hypothetical protein
MVHFCNGSFSHKLLRHHGHGHCHSGESTCQTRVWVLSSEQTPTTSSILQNNTVDSPFVFVQWTISLWLKQHKAGSWTASTFSPFLELPMPFRNTLFLHSVFNISQCFKGYSFIVTFTNLHTKMYVYLLLQILVTHSSASNISQTCTIHSAAWERMTHFVCSSCKRKMGSPPPPQYFGIQIYE